MEGGSGGETGRDDESGRETLPGATDAGVELLRLWEEEGEEVFLKALQSQLLALRQAGGEEGRRPSSEPEEAGDEEELLQARIAGLRVKEDRERLIADLLHLGTLYRLRASELELTEAPLRRRAPPEGGPAEAIPVTASLADSLRPLPAEAAAEVRGFVLAAASSDLAGGRTVQAPCEELGRLLMGAQLFGYFLARAMQGRTSGDVGLDQVVAAGDAEWESVPAFVAASARVGRLLALPPESPDPLRRYESLREVSTEIRLAPLEQADEYLASAGPSEERALVALEVEGLRGLLGEACAVGFTLRLWEAKLMRFASPPAAGAAG